MNGIARGILSMGAWNLAKILSSAALTAVLARSMGAAGYGEYAFYIALIGIVWPLANLGSSQTLTREIGGRPDDRRYQRRAMGALALLNLGGTLLTGGAVLVWLLWGDRSPTAVLIAGLVVGAIAGEQAVLFAKGVLVGRRRADLVSLPAAVGQVLSAGMAIAGAALGYGLPGVLAAICVTNLLTAAVTLRFALRQTQDCRLQIADCRLAQPDAAPDVMVHIDPKPNLTGNSLSVQDDGPHRAADSPEMSRTGDHTEVAIPALLRFSLGSMLYVALAFVLYRADLLLLRQLAGDVQAGLYAAAVQWAEFVWFVPLAVQEVVLQAASRLWHDRRPAELRELIERLLRYVALVAGLMLALVVALAEPLMTLYFGPEFREASTAVRLLAPGVFSFSLARVMVPAIQSRSPRGLVLVIGATVAGNLALNALLIPRWGAAGTAAACCLSYGWVFFGYLSILRRYGAAPSTGPLVRIAMLALATTGLVLPVGLLISQPLIAITVGGSLGTLCYLGGILWLGLLTQDEIRQLWRRVPARWRWVRA